MDKDSEKIRILLVDDQILFVENLKTVLELTTEDIEVVGIAADGAQALSSIEETMPDIVLMDVRMPVMDGVEATKEIRSRGLSVKILMLTTFDSDEYVREAIKAGADGYILKNIPPKALFESIRAMRSGAVLIAPEVAHHAFGDNAETQTEEVPVRYSSAVRKTFDQLTDREREVIEHIALAYSNREIAQRINLSEQTVKNYISRIYTKLNISRRSQLMRLYRELHLR